MSGPEPALTIYADASFDGNSRTGSWGAVIRKGHNEILMSGQFKLDCRDSTTAELQAIGNAIHRACGMAKAGAWVEVYSDCEAAVNALRGLTKFRQSRTHLRDALAMVQAMTDRTGWNVKFHWVKGHQPEGVTCPHVRGNRLADGLARDAHSILTNRREKARARQRRARRNRAARKAALACAREETPEMERA